MRCRHVTTRLRPGLAGLSRTASCHCPGFREPLVPVRGTPAAQGYPITGPARRRLEREL